VLIVLTCSFETPDPIYIQKAASVILWNWDSGIH